MFQTLCQSGYNSIIVIIRETGVYSLRKFGKSAAIETESCTQSREFTTFPCFSYQASSLSFLNYFIMRGYYPSVPTTYDCVKSNNNAAKCTFCISVLGEWKTYGVEFSNFEFWLGLVKQVSYIMQIYVHFYRIFLFLCYCLHARQRGYCYRFIVFLIDNH